LLPRFAPILAALGPGDPPPTLDRPGLSRANKNVPKISKPKNRFLTFHLFLRGDRPHADSTVTN
jgi:hypothetical protein